MRIEVRHQQARVGNNDEALIILFSDTGGMIALPASQWAEIVQKGNDALLEAGRQEHMYEWREKA